MFIYNLTRLTNRYTVNVMLEFFFYYYFFYTISFYFHFISRGGGVYSGQVTSTSQATCAEYTPPFTRKKLRQILVPPVTP